MSNFDWKFDWSKKEYNESLDEDTPYEKMGKISPMKTDSSMQDFLNRVFNKNKEEKSN